MANKLQASLPSPELVWITQGKTQHAAHLLETSPDGRSKVRWISTSTTEWLEAGAVIEKLSPRRERREPTQSMSSPSQGRNKKSEATAMAERKARRISFGDAATPPDNFKDKNDLELAADNSVDKYTPCQNATTEEMDDDSSIEFLLTIKGRSPKKKSLTGNKPPSEIRVDQSLEASDSPSTTAASTGVEKATISMDDCAPEHTSGDIDGSLMDKENILEIGTAALVKDELKTSPQPRAYQSPKKDLDCSKLAKVEPGQNKMPSLKGLPSKCGIQPQLQESASQSSLDPPYTFLSSAYVQNLAEMCHIIMTDRRWRVGPDQKCLLSWEFGDDLSAVIPLARRFRPSPPTNTRPKTTKCLGLLCNCEGESEEEDTPMPLEDQNAHPSRQDEAIEQEISPATRRVRSRRMKLHTGEEIVVALPIQQTTDAFTSTAGYFIERGHGLESTMCI
jgi:hypothetical protein